MRDTANPRPGSWTRSVTSATTPTLAYMLPRRGIRKIYLSVLASEFELSPAQCHVLHLIEPDRPVPMGRIAEALACDASNVTGLIDRLESRGLVQRQPSPEDRRVKVLQLTPAGSRLRAAMLERMTKPPDTLGRLSIDEQRALVKILKRLLD